jgi:hypothetical protein
MLTSKLPRVNLVTELQTVGPGSIASSFRMQQIGRFAHLSLKKILDLLHERSWILRRQAKRLRKSKAEFKSKEVNLAEKLEDYGVLSRFDDADPRHLRC